MTDVPYLAIGNSEPLPDNLPPELTDLIRGYRTKAGWCDHGRRLGECCPDPDDPDLWTCLVCGHQQDGPGPCDHGEADEDAAGATDG